jgi:uncharacterized spore protein YtfJ
MEEAGLEIGQAVAARGIRIIPVIQVSRNYCCVNGALCFFSHKKPAYVIIISASAKRVFRLTGEEISMEALFQEAPELLGKINLDF